MKIALDIFLDGGARGLERVFCKCLNSSRLASEKSAERMFYSSSRGSTYADPTPQLCG